MSQPFDQAGGHDDGDIDVEPIRGLPEAPPAGEHILWQGMPSWRALAWRAFGVRWVLVYFAAIGLWRAVDYGLRGLPAETIAGSVLVLVPVAMLVAGILAAMAWASARDTVYTITSERVMMRIGVVTTITLNLPFRWIPSAALKQHPDGTGDIALATSGDAKLAWLMLWPHVRPWRLSKAEPTLRALPDAGPVAELLARALRAAQARRMAAEETGAPQPRAPENATRDYPAGGHSIAAE